jgi:hypothetical protein
MGFEGLQGASPAAACSALSQTNAPRAVVKRTAKRIAQEAEVGVRSAAVIIGTLDLVEARA